MAGIRVRRLRCHHAVQLCVALLNHPPPPHLFPGSPPLSPHPLPPSDPALAPLPLSADYVDDRNGNAEDPFCGSSNATFAPDINEVLAEAYNITVVRDRSNNSNDWCLRRRTVAGMTSADWGLCVWEEEVVCTCRKEREK